MFKKTLIVLTLPLLFLLVVAASLCRGAPGSLPTTARRHLPRQASSAVATAPATGTLQKMIVESGSVTMDLDLNGLNGSSSLVARPVTLQFAVEANSFFPVLVFNNLLRGPTPGSMALVPAGVNSVEAAVPAAPNSVSQATRLPLQDLPPLLSASLKQLVVEKLPSGQGFDLAVRDGNTGFTFFNIQGHQYDYDPAAKSLSITGGRLLISKELANAMGRPSDAGSEAGTISVGAAMQPTEITQVVDGQPQSMVMPPLQNTAAGESPALVQGPDVIVGDLPDMEQAGISADNNFVGLGVGTTSCNNGNQPVNWFQLPQTDHPVIPQNFYRMSGGANNNERFEQLGQSWMKHAFFALEDDQCAFGCNTNGCSTGSQLCPGCSDTYGASLNDMQSQIGSRAWVNPFTGSFQNTANNHNGHTHTGTSHRVTVAVSDLDPAQNPGATYFAEGQYISPTEYTWCQAHPGQCNMDNNVSYRQYTVGGHAT